MSANVVELTEPYIIPPGITKVADTTFIIRPDFSMPYGRHKYAISRGALVVPPDHPGVEIVGCRIRGWADHYQKEWHQDFPRPVNTRPMRELNGIDLDHAQNVTVRDCIIERVPAMGLYLPAAWQVRIENIHVQHAFCAFQTDYHSALAEQHPSEFPKRTAQDIVVDRCTMQDTWQNGYPSRDPNWEDPYYPEDCIGAGSFYAYSVERLTVRKFSCTGASKGGSKIGLCYDVLIEDYMGAGFQIVSSLYFSAEKGPTQLDTVPVGTPDNPMLATRVRLHNLVLNHGLNLKQRLDGAGWPLQLSYPTADTVEIRGGHIWKNPNSNVGYSQAWEGFHADIREVTFHGPKPTAMPNYGSGGGLFSVGDYGTPKSTPSSFNEDLLTANEWREV